MVGSVHAFVFDEEPPPGSRLAVVEGKKDSAMVKVAVDVSNVGNAENVGAWEEVVGTEGHIAAFARAEAAACRVEIAEAAVGVD